ncbi:Uncharacterised protein [Salmonella enterica subsp. enterica serovar Bovismorbificans]|uniref:Uncharacterized protein n=1 Tax=Salmonella enterica subsp. enterica serovar Bovismorbificans TaxID=58097 RepID=A0A655D967_SALET|nr:Uncharacterised protein [Salmonella enterica subsp. enterica serovar Bovismorbificans]
MPFHVFDHNDGVIDNDTYRQDQTKQRKRIQRKAKQVHQGKGADQRNGNRHQRNNGRPPGLQEQHHDKDDQHEGFQQRNRHRL